MRDIKKLLGLRIKELRRNAGLTQEELAEDIGIEANNLSRIENGKNYPSPENLGKIADALDAEVHELFIFNHLKTIDEIKHIVKKEIDKDENLARLLFKFYQTVK